MKTHIRDLNSSELRLFGEIVARLSNLDAAVDAREVIFHDIVRLVRADYASSYIWSGKKQRFEHGIGHNMQLDHAASYHRYYQYRDPLTAKLRARRTATLVEEVASYSALRRTEFYNDFLLAQGLHHGINVFVFDGEKDLGDFRLWRALRSPSFGERERLLLDETYTISQEGYSTLANSTGSFDPAGTRSGLSGCKGMPRSGDCVPLEYSLHNSANAPKTGDGEKGLCQPSRTCRCRSARTIRLVHCFACPHF